jgi:hypothetical protein
LRQINGQIEAIDKHLKMLRNADSDLCQRFNILTRARASRARPGRQPRRSGACPKGQWQDPREAIHPWRPPTSQTGSLHARPQRHPMQP